MRQFRTILKPWSCKDVGTISNSTFAKDGIVIAIDRIILLDHNGFQPVFRSLSIPLLTLWNTGSSAGACHRAAHCADALADDDGRGCVTY